MRKHLLALMAISTVSIGAAQALPIGDKTAASSVVQNIEWRRVCDRDGDRCRRVWVRDRDEGFVFRFGRDRDWRREREHDERRERRRD